MNDTLGHAAGDTLLREAAQRFQKATRAGEMAARLGGDEFTFLLEGLKSSSSVIAVAERIQSILRTPFWIGGHEIVITASIGIAVNDGPHSPADEMLRRADVALYQAKAEGRNCYRLFAPQSEPRAFDVVEVGTGLRSAIDQNELELYFQPVIELTSGSVEGFEGVDSLEPSAKGVTRSIRFRSNSRRLRTHSSDRQMGVT